MFCFNKLSQRLKTSKAAKRCQSGNSAPIVASVAATHSSIRAKYKMNDQLGPKLTRKFAGLIVSISMGLRGRLSCITFKHRVLITSLRSSRAVPPCMIIRGSAMDSNLSTQRLGTCTLATGKPDHRGTLNELRRQRLTRSLSWATSMPSWSANRVKSMDDAAASAAIQKQDFSTGQIC